MFVRWDPEDGSEPKVYDFDPDDVLSKEATAVEKAYGNQSWEVWLNNLRIKEAKARRVLLWHLMRRDHPNLRFEDTPDFRMRQVKVEMSVKELRELMARTEQMKLSEEAREQMRMAFEIDIRDAMQRETGVYEGEVTEEEPNLPKPV